MADAALLADPMINDDDPLPIPPLDPSFFSDDFILSDNLLSLPDEDFDITFDDLFLPSDTEDEFVNSTFLGPNPTQFSSDLVTGTQLESGSDRASGDRLVAEYLDIPSFDSQESVERLNFPSSSPGTDDQQPVSSQGSGNCESAGSEGLNCRSPDSGNNSANNSINEVVDQKCKLEELGNVSVLKRKKEIEEANSGSKTSKLRRSNGGESATIGNCLNDDDDKKKARLIRNRESAQLSRQRKKHYVEELEDKVRAMHSTIQDLNAKISYIIAENVSLRQQMGSNGVGGGVCSPPPMMYQHPGMAPMAYPWMPCPPYLLQSQGSKVPLVPIPRWKPQASAVPKAKKVEGKKGESKTKKVASISFLGLLFFILLFGGLVPMVNVKYGGMRDAYSGVSGPNYVDSRLNDKHHGRVLAVNGHVNGTNHNKDRVFNEKFGDGISWGRGHDEPGSHPMPCSDEFKHNASEPLVASLYVPRNDKLVKIDGNLIIHSVLASEKTRTSRQEMEMTTNEETRLAVAQNLVPALPLIGFGRNDGKHPRQRESKVADGKLQQWFREGLAGPLLSSGMCTEVFQFDVSAAASGAIIPVRNMTAKEGQNSSYPNHMARNRRILHGLPIPLPADNITKEHSDKGNSHRNSSMIVSMLVDPREAGDGDGVDGVMGKKSSSFPRIFVVVLLDSVKYVTYSCMLPLMGSTHVVTT